MKLIRALYGLHVAAILFGLTGLIVFMPHPNLLIQLGGDPSSIGVAQRYTGSLHILLGAAALLVFGWRILGPRKTLAFFVVATLLPLGMELLGTGTGFPFGHYAYTDNLGYKVMGRVPYSIPLSWFYMGFTSYLLAFAILSARQVRRASWWALLLGAWFLTAWDLVLDPAMASPNLPFRFWIWSERSPITYYGMPIQNFIGWSITGLLFMTAARLAWSLVVRRDTRIETLPVNFPRWFPFAMYAANMGFAFALSLSVSLWQPLIFASLLGLLPAALVLRAPAGSGGAGPGAARSSQVAIEGLRGGAAASPLEGIAHVIIRTCCVGLGRRNLQMSVEGAEQFPRAGATLVVARHYHHLYDGSALMAFIPRPIHIFVALDWVRARWVRNLMEWACHTARWPIVLRFDHFARPAGAGASAYHADEARRYLRRAVVDAVRLLREGQTLVIFPEAYPNIDPSYTPKAGAAFLPFRDGFMRLVELAERDGVTHVQIVPAGLAYELPARGRGRVIVRMGVPLTRSMAASSEALGRRIEENVRALSAAAPTTASATQPQGMFQL